ncbi:hypothetical protein [Tuwongella immobilis]|uniref:Uncharacterized protein n=1 Tax=Tuwongella immobilis TaxID=692036 RepID=A0A6C2YTA7_9BACT|nr:hypothetical protein [Tuwongella immobilis]VIP04269.1 unnamed protein product [Tuwongella immobilis]VTS05901.1 unnamed protein product [Tuwongella immobilis]
MTALPMQHQSIQKSACVWVAMLCGIVVGCEPSLEVRTPFQPQLPKVEPATLTITRTEQWTGSVHRHTVYVNGNNVGLIRNGETLSFQFMPSINGTNSIYVEGYDPIVTNPVTNTESLKVGSGGAVSATTEWGGNLLVPKLELRATVINSGSFPGGDQDRIQAAVAAAQAEIDDPNALVPAWYRKALKATHTPKTQDIYGGTGVNGSTTIVTAEPKIESKMIKSSYTLAIALFAFASAIFCWREVFSRNGLFASSDTVDAIVASVLVFAVGVGGALGLAWVGGWLLTTGSGIVCPIIAGEDSYLPEHYAQLTALWFMMLLATLFIAVLYVVYPVARLFFASRMTSFGGSGHSGDRSAHLRHILRAGMKALLIAGAGLIARQFGEWMIGLIVVFVATVVAAIFDPSPANDS